MSDERIAALETQVAALGAQLSELLSVPRVAQMRDAYRQSIAAAANAVELERQAQERRDREIADLRARVEADPVLRVTASGVPRVATNRGFDVAQRGDPFKGGRAIGYDGLPTPAEVVCLASEWTSRLATDEELREHVAAKRLHVEPVAFDEILADRRGRRRFARLYQ